jgi:hypothetical protein
MTFFLQRHHTLALRAISYSNDTDILFHKKKYYTQRWMQLDDSWKYIEHTEGACAVAL